MSNTHERDALVVLRHAGKSYVRSDYNSAVYAHSSGTLGSGTGLHINHQPARSYPVSAGDPEMLEIDGEVWAVDRRYSPKRIVTSYKARPEFESALKAPLSVVEYEAMDEERRGLIYEPVYREEIVYPVDFPFSVIDLDVTPRKFPEGFLVTVPDYLRRFRCTWHSLPCQYDAKLLFKRLAAAVQAEAKGREGFSVNFYENIVTLRVSVDVTITGFDQRIHLPLIDIDDKTNRVPTITGDNLDDLMAKVDAWIEAKVKLVRDVHTPPQCPCCGQATPPGSKLIVPIGRRR